MSDEILLRLSRVKFTLHRFMMNLLEVPADAMTSDQPYRERFARRLADGCPDLPGLDNAVLDIRKGIFGTFSLMNLAHAERLLSDKDFEDLCDAYYFCNGSRELKNATTFADGKQFAFSEDALKNWEKILGLQPV